MDEILGIFRQNFPYVSREEQTLMGVISHEGNATFRRSDGDGRLMGCAIVNRNTILLLVVEKEYRGQGIGTELLDLRGDNQGCRLRESGAGRWLRLSHAWRAYQPEIRPKRA